LQKQQRSIEYNATIIDGTRIKITHPYLDFSGKEYILAAQYIRCGRLFLQCVDETKRRIITIPASFTDYTNDPLFIKDISDIKSHFTLESLSEVDSILNDSLKMSTE